MRVCQRFSFSFHKRRSVLPAERAITSTWSDVSTLTSANLGSVIETRFTGHGAWTTADWPTLMTTLEAPDVDWPGPSPPKAWAAQSPTDTTVATSMSNFERMVGPPTLRWFD